MDQLNRLKAMSRLIFIPELRVAVDVKEDFEEACHGMKSSSR